MEKHDVKETAACAQTRARLPEFLLGNLKAEARGRVRGHLLSCQACALFMADTLAASAAADSTTNVSQPPLRPPARALEALGVRTEREGVVWTALQSLATDRVSWAQAEMDTVRRTLQGALLLWAIAQAARRPRARGALGAREVALERTLGPDEEWPSQIDVEIVDSSGQPQGRTVRFEVIEPPTVTPTGEFLLALRTEESGVAGWFLCCTVTIGGVKVTFSGELQEEVDNWGWQARIEATGLPASQEPVVIPLDPWVHLSLQERPQTEESRSQPTDLEAIPAWALLVGARSGDRSAVREEAPGTVLPVSEAAETVPSELRLWVQPASSARGKVTYTKGAMATFRVGEPIRIGFSASRDAYVYLLDVDAEGTVTLIFPSGNWKENHARGKQRYFLPREDEALELPVEGPPGVETLIAIAAVQPVPVLAEWQQAGEDSSQPPRPVSQQDLARVTQALSRLPRGQWAVGQFQFVVRE